jgi:hypothetical protein
MARVGRALGMVALGGVLTVAAAGPGAFGQGAAPIREARDIAEEAYL